MTNDSLSSRLSVFLVREVFMLWSNEFSLSPAFCFSSFVDAFGLSASCSLRHADGFYFASVRSSLFNSSTAGYSMSCSSVYPMLCSTSFSGLTVFWIYSTVFGRGASTTCERGTLSTARSDFSITTMWLSTSVTCYDPSATTANLWRCWFGSFRSTWRYTNSSISLFRDYLRRSR